jgi:Spy/CpxP family protein refolding chaperone
MKIRCHNRKAAAIFAALVASVISTPAQPDKNATPERRPPPGEERGRFQPPQGGGPAGRFGPGFERLQSVLTDDQRASLREAMQGQREKMRDLEEKIRGLRQELLLAGLTEKFDEESVRRKALAVAKLEAEMTMVRAKAFSQMRPALNPEQLEKLKARPENRREDQPEAPRRRPGAPRDEHGLPLKDGAPAPKPAQP